MSRFIRLHNTSDFIDDLNIDAALCLNMAKPEIFLSFHSAAGYDVQSVVVSMAFILYHTTFSTGRV